MSLLAFGAITSFFKTRTVTVNVERKDYFQFDINMAADSVTLGPGDKDDVVEYRNMKGMEEGSYSTETPLKPRGSRTYTWTTLRRARRDTPWRSMKGREENTG